MIEINLLPPEHRPVEHTPLPRLLTIFAGVLLVAGGVVAWLWLSVVAVPRASRACELKKQDMLKAQAEAAKVKQIDDELKAAKDREGVLRELFDKRIAWARLLDRMAEARSKLGDGEDVVLTNVDLKKSSGAGAPGRRTETRQLYVKGFVPSNRKDALDGELRQTCFKFLQNLSGDEEFKKDFECEDKGEHNAKYQYLGEQMTEVKSSSSGARKAEGGDTGPKSMLTFEVTFNFKAPPAPAPKQVGPPAARPAPARAH